VEAMKVQCIFFVKYTTMLYQWQLVKNNVIQSNFPGNFHDKISLRISLQKYFFQVIDDYEKITGRCVL
jgi:hypothetical protein